MALTETQIAKARALLKDEQFAEFMYNLYCRWLDEREYEDFADYATAIKKNLSAGIEFVKAHKRPFGLTFKADGAAINYSITADGRRKIKQV